jgi:hypothetical protein
MLIPSVREIQKSDILPVTLRNEDCIGSKIALTGLVKWFKGLPGKEESKISANKIRLVSTTVNILVRTTLRIQVLLV